MSQQLRIRFYQNNPPSEYESNLLSKSFELFESLKDSLETVNFLAVPMTSNEEELTEIIEEEFGGEPEGDDWEEFEENVERELGLRGEFFLVRELQQAVTAYREYFRRYSEKSFAFGFNHQANGELFAEDLENLEKELEKSPSGRARFVIS